MNPALPKKGYWEERKGWMNPALPKKGYWEERKGWVKRRYTFSQGERIKRNFEYRKILKKGACYRNGVFVLAISKNDIGRNRLGVSIGISKVPTSSARNRIKRLVREVFRLNKAKFKNGPYDIVIMLNPALPKDGYRDKRKGGVKATPPEGINYSIVENKLAALLKKAHAL